MIFWADEISKEIIQTLGKRHLIATGITPSGQFHIGHAREMVIADTIYKALKEQGVICRLVFIADDFDPLRRLYPFLPKEFEKFIGNPLSKIPDPDPINCHKSYAQHYLEPFLNSLPKLGIEIEKLSATSMYESGFYKDVIKEALVKKEEIKKIFEKVCHRKIEKDWSPFHPLCKKCGKINSAVVTKEHLEGYKVEYSCKACGEKGTADFSKGEGKLSWRVDWSARWKMLGVTIEPFGKDHAAAGGSYDTAKRISKEVFDYDPPYGIFYEYLYLVGTEGKMSSSIGNVISIDDALKVMSPEILRFMLIRNKNRHIDFDPGQTIPQLIDEFAKIKEEYIPTDRTPQDRLYEFSRIREDKFKKKVIPLTHLSMVYQAAQGNIDEIIRLLKRTGYATVKKEDSYFTEQIERTKNWLKKYAPENFRFEIRKKLPKDLKLTKEQKELISATISRLEEGESDPQILHNFIYDKGKSLNLRPMETFQPFYQILLGKNSGPKLGWFLMILDPKFLLTRLKDSIKI